MPVITISRQFGAAGRPVGRMLAERFAAATLDREIVAAVAARSGIPVEDAEGYDERLPSLWQRMAAALAASSPEVSMPPLPSESIPGSALQDRLIALTRAVILEAADRGNAVITGRGGVFIIGRRPDVLHVQLHASMETRLRYLLTRVEEIPLDTKPDEASLRELCESFDRARGNYIRRLYGKDWLDTRHYDLAVDVGRMGVEGTVDLVESAARRLSAEGSTPTT